MIFPVIIISYLITLIVSNRREVTVVKEGFECGIGIEDYNDLKVGDSIEAYSIVETARTLQ